MKTSKHPFLPMTRVAQGQSLEAFESAFDDRAEVYIIAIALIMSMLQYRFLWHIADWKQYSRQRRLCYTVAKTISSWYIFVGYHKTNLCGCNGVC